MGYLASVPVNAGADLSGLQYHAIQIDGTIATTGANAIGINQFKPELNEDAAAGFLGRSRYRAGAAVAAGAQLTVTAGGWVITATSGSYPVGKALSAIGSGGIAEGIFNFAGNGVSL